MMVSAANGAKLISNSVAPSAMAMYFIVIFPYPIIAPVNGASRFIVIEATFSCSVLRYARFVQSAFKMPQNRRLGRNPPLSPRRFCKFTRQIIRSSDRMTPSVLRQDRCIVRLTLQKKDLSDFCGLLICVKVAAGFPV